MTRLTRGEVIAAVASFAGIFVAAIVAHLLVLAGLPEATVQNTLKVVVILLFCVFGFALIGLMIHVFVVLQGGIGNADVGMVRFLRENERMVTYGTWIFLGIGTLIAVPFALWDMGVQWKPALKPQGVLVADIGMTLDDVRKQSSLKLRAPFTVQSSGQTYCIGEAVFDYQLGNSGMRFPKSRYYWMITGDGGDPQLAALNIGLTPEKLPRHEFDDFKHQVRQRLKDDGWVPGHFVWNSKQEVESNHGVTTSGDGRYWKRGDTLLILEEKRMDDEQPGEDAATAGEFILYLDLRHLSSERKLVFDPAIWPGK
jgi:hypothetical protein